MANASTYRATINLGDLRQGRKGQARIRNGQKHNMGARRVEARSTKNFQEPSCHRNSTGQQSLPWPWAWREVAKGQPVSVLGRGGGGGNREEGYNGGSGSAPQTRLLPHTCFLKTKGETGPRVEEGQGPTLRTLQSHEKTQRYLSGVSRANATDLPVFRNGRDVADS